jgi:hypothetical protein
MRRYFLLLSICIASMIHAQEVRVDSLRGYKIKVPAWLHVIYDSEKIFGGSLPEVDSIENFISITAYDKSDFKSFKQFKDIYIRKNVFGEPALYSKEHTNLFYWKQRPLISGYISVPHPPPMMPTCPSLMSLWRG